MLSRLAGQADRRRHSVGNQFLPPRYSDAALGFVPRHMMRALMTLLGVQVLWIAGLAMPAKAVYFSGGMSTRTFCVQNPSVNSTWMIPINAGRAGWNNNISFPGNISEYSGCVHSLHVGSYGLGWLGQYSKSSYYTIRLDSVNLNNHINNNGYTFGNVVRSTTAHEFGHALRLGDHSDQPTKLMSSSRNRNQVMGVTTAEMNESNGYY